MLMQRTKRFECSAPVAFWWPLGQGVVQSGLGVTRNISNSGVLIEASECPAVGTPIQMMVFLPRIEGNGYRMKLNGEGVVVRVEGEETGLDQGLTRFAASVQFYQEPVDGSEQPAKDSAKASTKNILSDALRGARKNSF